MAVPVSTFVERVAEWQAFYAVLAASAATFAGLLFVSLSLNPVLLDPHQQGAARLARHTFGCFIYLVLISLVVMIPRQIPLGIGVPLFGLGLGGLLQTFKAFREAKGSGRRLGRERPLYLLSIATYLTLLLVALALAYGRVEALYALVTLMIWQLAWATRLAWDLLMVRE